MLSLLWMDVRLEWKQKYAINGLLLYVLSMVVVISLAFVERLSPLTFTILYWLIILFAAINAVARSFTAERPEQQRYLYTLAHPTSIILAKIIYNTLLLLGIGMISLLLYATLSNTAIENFPLMLAVVSLSCWAFASNLTLVAAIAARAENRSTLLAVLSFPIIIPVLLTTIRVSRIAVEGLAVSFSYKSLYFLGGFSLVLAGISVILFPFIWRN